jgi:hypothetical protein
VRCTCCSGAQPVLTLQPGAAGAWATVVYRLCQTGTRGSQILAARRQNTSLTSYYILRAHLPICNMTTLCIDTLAPSQPPLIIPGPSLLPALPAPPAPQAPRSPHQVASGLRALPYPHLDLALAQRAGYRAAGCALAGGLAVRPGLSVVVRIRADTGVVRVSECLGHHSSRRSNGQNAFGIIPKSHDRCVFGMVRVSWASFFTA